MLLAHKLARKSLLFQITKNAKINENSFFRSEIGENNFLQPTSFEYKELPNAILWELIEKFFLGHFALFVICLKIWDRNILPWRHTIKDHQNASKLMYYSMQLLSTNKNVRNSMASIWQIILMVVHSHQIWV